VKIWLSLAAVLAAACSSPDVRAPDAPRLRLWHTFSPRETQALNDYLAAHAPDVEPTLLPFSRAQLIVREALEAGTDCPDLVRIDATWLPGLAGADLIQPVPASTPPRRWLPEAAGLAAHDGEAYGLPQAIDGLALLYDVERVRSAGVPWPPQTVNDLVATAHRLTMDGKFGLSARIDGYWFLAFLRAWGGDAIDPNSGAIGIDDISATNALTRFAALFGPGGVAPPPPPPGAEAPTAARRFRAGEVAVLVDGPWAVAELREGGRTLGVTPFPRDPLGRPAAPFGGQLFVVPRCARDPDGAWQLAHALTDPELQAEWSRELGIVPTTAEALERAGEFAQQFRAALQQTRPLPRHPITTEMFDDLTPAVAAVVAGDATAEEALPGVARAWGRLLAHHREPAR